MEIGLKTVYHLKNMEENVIEENDVISKSTLTLKYYDDMGQLKEIAEKMAVTSISETEIEMIFVDDDLKKPLTIPIEKLVGWTSIPEDYYLVNKETQEEIHPGSYNSSMLLVLVYRDDGDSIKVATDVEVLETTATEVTFAHAESGEEFTIHIDQIIDYKTEQYYYKHMQQHEQGEKEDKGRIPVLSDIKDTKNEKNVPADVAKHSMIERLHKKQEQLKKQNQQVVQSIRNPDRRNAYERIHDRE